MKNILFMVLSFSIFLLFSCSDKEENEPFIPVDEIISAKTFLIPNKDTKVISTILNFTTLSQELHKEVQTGQFGADMKVELINDGPVTIIIDSKNRQ